MSKGLSPERMVGTYVHQASDSPTTLKEMSMAVSKRGAHCIPTLEPDTLHFTKDFKCF